jgi:hypothetical protein
MQGYNALGVTIGLASTNVNDNRGEPECFIVRRTEAAPVALKRDYKEKPETVRVWGRLRFSATREGGREGTNVGSQPTLAYDRL